MLANLDIAPWAEYGIAGLVIAALLGFLWLFLKRQADHIDSQQQHMREKDDLHRSERAEWRKEADARAEKLNQSLDTLTDAIRFGGRRE